MFRPLALLRSGLALYVAAGCTPSSAGPPEPGGQAASRPADPLSPDSLAGTFEGYYSAGFEHTGFRPCADTLEAWWTEPASTHHPVGRDQYRMEMAPAADIHAAYVALTGYDGVAVDGPVVWARFRGRATPRDGRGHGHDGQYGRTFAVDSVEAMAAEAPADACARPAGGRP